MFLETEMYGRHCSESILEYLVPCCLWHVRSAPRTNCLFLSNTSCFCTEDMEACAYRCKDPGQGSGLSSLLDKQGFNKLRGRYTNIKTLLTKCYLGDLMPVLPLPVLPSQRVLHGGSLRKELRSQPRCLKQHLQVSKRSGDRVHTQAGESLIRIWLNWKQLFWS